MLLCGTRACQGHKYGGGEAPEVAWLRQGRSTMEWQDHAGLVVDEVCSRQVKMEGGGRIYNGGCGGSSGRGLLVREL